MQHVTQRLVQLLVLCLREKKQVTRDCYRPRVAIIHIGIVCVCMKKAQQNTGVLGSSPGFGGSQTGGKKDVCVIKKLAVTCKEWVMVTRPRNGVGLTGFCYIRLKYC